MKEILELQLCEVSGFLLTRAHTMGACLSHQRKVSETLSPNEPLVSSSSLAQAFCHSNRKLTHTHTQHQCIMIIPSAVSTELQLGFGRVSALDHS